MESGLLHTLMARYEAEGVAPDGDIHRGEYNPLTLSEGWWGVGENLGEICLPDARQRMVL